ncbi:MAG: caspase family protein [Candidatus Brocadiales bacterium]|nr:caspase family protein [Candidatus Bathyanammoxibius sp.]
MKMKRLSAIEHSKPIVIFIFAILLLMGFSGCAPTLIQYDSTIGDPNAIQARANISVIIDEHNLVPKFLNDLETKRSIIEVISGDLQRNIFAYGDTKLDVIVRLKELHYTHKSHLAKGFILAFLFGPLGPILFPTDEYIGSASLLLEIRRNDGSVIRGYQSKRAHSVKTGLPNMGKITGTALQLALEDIKYQIIEDKYRIVQAIKEKQPIIATKPVVVEKKPEKIPPKEAPTYSDVDRNIPISRNQNPDALAVVLGIEKYRNIPDVSYARRDAATFREYAARVLGIKDDIYHLYYRVDEEATKAEFEKLFAADGWIARRARPTTDVYIYYAGHGAPEVRERSAYLIPYDGDINYPIQTGFSLNRLYEELGKLEISSVTVFLDACFSGVSRDDEVLLADARPVYIELEGPTAQGDITVFSAATGSQVSSAWPEQGHGLFTYYLLKGLKGEADQNWDEQITLGELSNYLTENVSRRAGLLDREQTPLMITREESRVLVQYR